MLVYECPKHGVRVTVEEKQRRCKLEVLLQPGQATTGQCWLSTHYSLAFPPRNEDLEQAVGASGCPVTRVN